MCLSILSFDRSSDDVVDNTDSVASIFLIAGRRPEDGLAVVDRAMVVKNVVVVKDIRAVVAISKPQENILWKTKANYRLDIYSKINFCSVSALVEMNRYK